jgi:hypothetical protein
METLGYLLIRWVFAAFATYRVARMLALEEGPFGLFDKMRDGAERAFGDSWLGRGLACPYCTGFWIALVAALAVTELASAFEFVMVWLSIAGAQTYLQATEGEP